MGSSGNGRQGTGHSAGSQGSGVGRARALARQLKRRQGTCKGDLVGGGGGGGGGEQWNEDEWFPPSPFL